MLYSGNLEHATSYSGTAGASAAGFDVSFSSGGTYICRKYVTLDYTFSSNYNLN